MILPFELPLDPTPDEARTRLATELGKRAYRESWVEGGLNWLLGRLSPDGVMDAGNVLEGVVITGLILIAVGVLVLVLRTRVVSSRRAETSDASGDVLLESGISAETYRQRAAAALALGDPDGATVASFRAMAVDLKTRTVLDGAPSRTAHEITRAASARFPAEVEALTRAATAFDDAAYGVAAGPRTTTETALFVRDLDERIRRATPRWDS